jgi:hypothetical protein
MLCCSGKLVTPLECALTKNAAVSALECALTNSLDLKSFGIRTYKKVGGRGLRLLSAWPRASGHAFKRANCGPMEMARLAACLKACPDEELELSHRP